VNRVIRMPACGTNAFVLCSGPATLSWPVESEPEFMTIASPCTKVCTMDPVSDLCVGCGRTLAEIARWGSMPDEERRRIVAALPDRLAARRLRVTASEER
jgi:predicted Fe-S protein YdhL (DUF1289 family)